MTIARFSPMTDIVSLRDAMDRLFEESFIRPNTWTGLAAGHLAVPVDLWETKNAYHLRADLPGVSPDQLDINATSDSISLSGEVKGQADVTEDGWLRQERRVGKFQRTFTLPDGDRSEQGRGHVRARRSAARSAEGREREAADDQGQRNEGDL
jgi:HSP20 family protein